MHFLQSICAHNWRKNTLLTKYVNPSLTQFPYVHTSVSWVIVVADTKIVLCVWRSSFREPCYLIISFSPFLLLVLLQTQQRSHHTCAVPPGSDNVGHTHQPAWDGCLGGALFQWCRCQLPGLPQGPRAAGSSSVHVRQEVGGGAADQRQGCTARAPCWDRPGEDLDQDQD